MGEIMRRALIILIVVFSVFLTIGCMENKSETSISITNKTVNETLITEITPATVTLTEEMATENQNGTKIQNTKLMQRCNSKAGSNKYIDNKRICT